MLIRGHYNGIDYSFMQLREKLLHPFHTPAIPHYELVLAECAQLQRELAGKGPWDMGALKITSCKTLAGQDSSEDSSSEAAAGAQG